MLLNHVIQSLWSFKRIVTDPHWDNVNSGDITCCLSLHDHQLLYIFMNEINMQDNLLPVDISNENQTELVIFMLM